MKALRAAFLCLASAVALPFGAACGGALHEPRSFACHAPGAGERISAIVTKHCTSCHSPDGSAGPDHDWTDREKLLAARAGVAARVRSGAMPPAGEPRLTATERDELVTWAECDRDPHPHP